MPEITLFERLKKTPHKKPIGKKSTTFCTRSNREAHPLQQLKKGHHAIVAHFRTAAANPVNLNGIVVP
jgi:hypothetical protein